MKNVTSVFLAILVAVIGLAWQPTPTSAAPSDIIILPPRFIVAQGLNIALEEKMVGENWLYQRFSLQNNTGITRFVTVNMFFLGDTGSCRVFLSIQHKDGTHIFPGKNQIEVLPGQNCKAMVTLLWRENSPVLIETVLRELPQLRNVKFQMKAGVVHVSWESIGNAGGEPIRMNLFSVPQNLFHSAAVADNGECSININSFVESFPGGEYYIMCHFSSWGGEDWHSPIYYSPGPAD
ncbi:MAG: hypothetical protein V1705_01390 [bacterium]